MTDPSATLTQLEAIRTKTLQRPVTLTQDELDWLPAMNGLEWLAGYGGHENFHHRQIDALIAQLGERVLA